MAIPGQTISIQDPGLGLTSPSTNIPLMMGSSSSGTVDTVVSFSKLGDVVPALGEGPLSEMVMRQLQIAGGPVLAMKIAATVVGINSAVTASGIGPDVTLFGAPFDSYDAIVTIVAGGVLGTGTFKYSLDGGTTESSTLTIPLGGAFIIPNTNVTATFTGAAVAIASAALAAGTGTDFTTSSPHGLAVGSKVTHAGFSESTYNGDFTVTAITSTTVYEVAAITFVATGTGTLQEHYVATETYSWTSTEPQSNPTDVAAGFTAPELLDLEFDYVTLVTTYAAAADANTMFAALDGHLASLFNDFEYQRGIMDSGPESDTTTKAAFVTTSTRISPCFGTATHPSANPFVGRSVRVSALSLQQSIEAGRQLISTDLARVLNGPLSGVTAISHNEANTETMDQAKFTTARTWKGRTGFFLTNARFKSPGGSDFLYWQHGRIVDEASKVVQREQQLFLSENVRTTGATNIIDERDAKGFETIVDTALAVVLTSPKNAKGTQGHVTGFDYLIDRTNNVLTSETIISDTAVKPFGYIKQITTTIGFTTVLLSETEEAA